MNNEQDISLSNEFKDKSYINKKQDTNEINIIINNNDKSYSKDYIPEKSRIISELKEDKFLHHFKKDSKNKISSFNKDKEKTITVHSANNFNRINYKNVKTNNNTKIIDREFVLKSFILDDNYGNDNIDTDNNDLKSNILRNKTNFYHGNDNNFNTGRLPDFNKYIKMIKPKYLSSLKILGLNMSENVDRNDNINNINKIDTIEKEDNNEDRRKKKDKLKDTNKLDHNNADGHLKNQINNGNKYFNDDSNNIENSIVYNIFNNTTNTNNNSVSQFKYKEKKKKKSAKDIYSHFVPKFFKDSPNLTHRYNPIIHEIHEQQEMLDNEDIDNSSLNQHTNTYCYRKNSNSNKKYINLLDTNILPSTRNRFINNKNQCLNNHLPNKSLSINSLIKQQYLQSHSNQNNGVDGIAFNMFNRHENMNVSEDITKISDNNNGKINIYLHQKNYYTINILDPNLLNYNNSNSNNTSSIYSSYPNFHNISILDFSDKGRTRNINNAMKNNNYSTNINKNSESNYYESQSDINNNRQRKREDNLNNVYFINNTNNNKNAKNIIKEITQDNRNDTEETIRIFKHDVNSRKNRKVNQSEKEGVRKQFSKSVDNKNIDNTNYKYSHSKKSIYNTESADTHLYDTYSNKEEITIMNIHNINSNSNSNNKIEKIDSQSRDVIKKQSTITSSSYTINQQQTPKVKFASSSSSNKHTKFESFKQGFKLNIDKILKDNEDYDKKNQILRFDKSKQSLVLLKSKPNSNNKNNTITLKDNKQCTNQSCKNIYNLNTNKILKSLLKQKQSTSFTTKNINKQSKVFFMSSINNINDVKDINYVKDIKEVDIPCTYRNTMTNTTTNINTNRSNFQFHFNSVHYNNGILSSLNKAYKNKKNNKGYLGNLNFSSHRVKHSNKYLDFKKNIDKNDINDNNDLDFSTVKFKKLSNPYYDIDLKSKIFNGNFSDTSSNCSLDSNSRSTEKNDTEKSSNYSSKNNINNEKNDNKDNKNNNISLPFSEGIKNTQTVNYTITNTNKSKTENTFPIDKTDNNINSKKLNSLKNLNNFIKNKSKETSLSTSIRTSNMFFNIKNKNSKSTKLSLKDNYMMLKQFNKELNQQKKKHSQFIEYNPFHHSSHIAFRRLDKHVTDYLNIQKKTNQEQSIKIYDQVKDIKHKISLLENNSSALFWIKIVDSIIFILITLSFFIGAWDNIIYSNDKTDYTYDDEGNVTSTTYYKAYQEKPFTSTLKFINFGVIITTNFFVFIRYMMKLDRMKISNKVPQNFSIFSWKLMKPLLLEMMFISIFAPPGVYTDFNISMLGFEVKYSLPSLIFIISLTKLVYLFRIFGHYSIFNQTWVKVFAKQLKRTINVKYALKAQLSYNPFYTLAIFYSLIFIIFTIIVNSFEKDNSITSDVNENNNGKQEDSSGLDSLSETAWYIIVTMMTVGYGDYVPNTVFGCFFGLIAGIIGLMLVSLGIAFFGSFSELNKKQNTVFLQFRHEEYKVEKSKIAVSVIKSMLLLNKVKQKYKISNSNEVRKIQRKIISDNSLDNKDNQDNLNSNKNINDSVNNNSHKNNNNIKIINNNIKENNDNINSAIEKTQKPKQNNSFSFKLKSKRTFQIVVDAIMFKDKLYKLKQYYAELFKVKINNRRFQRITIICDIQVPPLAKTLEILNQKTNNDKQFFETMDFALDNTRYLCQQVNLQEKKINKQLLKIGYAITYLGNLMYKENNDYEKNNKNCSNNSNIKSINNSKDNFNVRNYLKFNSSKSAVANNCENQFNFSSDNLNKTINTNAHTNINNSNSDIINNNNANNSKMQLSKRSELSNYNTNRKKFNSTGRKENIADLVIKENLEHEDEFSNEDSDRKTYSSQEKEEILISNTTSNKDNEYDDNINISSKEDIKNEL